MYEKANFHGRKLQRHLKNRTRFLSGEKTISIEGVFENGEKLKDYYSDQMVEVTDGKVNIDSPFDIVLLGK